MSHMNLILRSSCHPAESLTALGTKLRSSTPSSLSTSISFCQHDSYSCVSADSFRKPPSSSSASLPHCSWNLGLRNEPFRLGSPGDRTSAWDLQVPDAPPNQHQLQQHPSLPALWLPSFSLPALLASIPSLPRAAPFPSPISRCPRPACLRRQSLNFLQHLGFSTSASVLLFFSISTVVSCNSFTFAPICQRWGSASASSGGGSDGGPGHVAVCCNGVPLGGGEFCS